jgi:hypothetical protein
MQATNEIVKICKHHGSLKLHEVYVRKVKYFDCKYCSLKNNKEWVKNNRERRNESKRRDSRKNSHRFKEYYAKNREKFREYSKKSRLKNLDKIREQKKIYIKKTGNIASKKLSDSYIRRLINGKHPQCVPPEIIPAYREYIKLRRMLREDKYRIK